MNKRAPPGPFYFGVLNRMYLHEGENPLMIAQETKKIDSRV